MSRMDKPDLNVQKSEAIAEHISNYGNTMDVATLVSKLAGLPPMMPVFANADGTSMFVNGLQIESVDENSPPFLRVLCSIHLTIPESPPLNKDEAEARQRQNAMQLSKNIQDSEKMPEVVE